jgi:hypothetical protein
LSELFLSSCGGGNWLAVINTSGANGPRRFQGGLIRAASNDLSHLLFQFSTICNIKCDRAELGGVNGPLISVRG